MASVSRARAANMNGREAGLCRNTLPYVRTPSPRPSRSSSGRRRRRTTTPVLNRETGAVVPATGWSRARASSAPDCLLRRGRQSCDDPKNASGEGPAMFLRSKLLAAALTTFAAVTFVAPPAAAAPKAPPKDPIAVGHGGAVSSVDPYATEIGLDILKRGGNAVDAAVATA